MRKLRNVKEGEAAAGLTGAALFKILWDELSDLLGGTATAVVVDRAARRARVRSRELGGLTISRIDGRFVYVVPISFDRNLGPSGALCSLMEELAPLLTELTGRVALQHLAQVPELRNWSPQSRPTS